MFVEYWLNLLLKDKKFNKYEDLYVYMLVFKCIRWLNVFINFKKFGFLDKMWLKKFDGCFKR